MISEILKRINFSENNIFLQKVRRKVFIKRYQDFWRNIRRKFSAKDTERENWERHQSAPILSSLGVEDDKRCGQKMTISISDFGDAMNSWRNKMKLWWYDDRPYHMMVWCPLSTWWCDYECRLTWGRNTAGGDGHWPVHPDGRKHASLLLVMQCHRSSVFLLFNFFLLFCFGLFCLDFFSICVFALVLLFLLFCVFTFFVFLRFFVFLHFLCFYVFVFSGFCIFVFWG